MASTDIKIIILDFGAKTLTLRVSHEPQLGWRQFFVTSYDMFFDYHFEVPNFTMKVSRKVFETDPPAIAEIKSAQILAVKIREEFSDLFELD